MNAGDWIGAAQNAIQGAAILVGGAWAYFKFVNGRTLHRRAELNVDASLLSHGGAVRARATMRNTGAAKIPLRLKIVQVETFEPNDVDEHGRPTWRQIAKNTPIFDDHDSIESQETIGDDLLVPISDLPNTAVAICVTCIAWEEQKRRKRTLTAWTAKSIILLGEQQRELPKGAVMSEKSREYQREGDEQEVRRIEQELEERQRESTEEEVQKVEQETKDD
jgi:hypothetical protein